MTDTHIYLVRHGQSTHNRRKRVAGQLPSSLTKQGREDARAVACLLKGRRLDLVYSSDLQRARQTAEIIRASLSLSCPMRVSPLLRELDYGRFTHRLVRETFTFLDYRRNRDSRYPGGEGFEDLERRARLFVERLRSEVPGQHILVTTHAGPIRVLLTVLEAVGPDEVPGLSISNRYVGRVVLDGGGEFRDYSVLGSEPGTFC